jgi:AcrB/AcrD/AcrF family
VNLSEPFIHRPVATSLVMAAIAFVGIAAFPFLPVASLPQIDFPTIQVTATLASWPSRRARPSKRPCRLAVELRVGPILPGASSAGSIASKLFPRAVLDSLS